MLSIKEAINKRKSVRTFDSREIEDKKLREIEELLEKNSTDDYKLIISREENGLFKGLGTYGVIKGAKYYIVVLVNKSIRDQKEKLVEFGSRFEKVIIELTKLGFGSCWMAGTFNKSTFAKNFLDKYDDILIVSPIGYDSGKKRLIEKGVALLVKSTSRKEYKEIYFDESLVGLEKKDEVLDLLRVAPSAVNRQPWRVIKEGKSYHLFGDKSSYKEGLTTYYIDMGIAKAHIELGGEYLNLGGKWVEEDKKFGEFEYIGTYRY